MAVTDLDNILAQARQHHGAGRLREAEALYRQFLSAQPENSQVLHLLGLALVAQNRLAEAISELRRAVAVRPDYAEAVYNLARALHDDGQLQAAAQTYRRAIALRPSFASAYNNLGIVLQLDHDFESAEAAFRQAILVQSNLPESHYNIGNVLKEQNRLDDAVASYRRALKHRPDYPDALVNLGNVLQRTGELDEAISLFRRAISINPGFALAHNSLGNALKDAGDLNSAIDSYRRSIAAEGDNWAWDNLLYTIHFHPDYVAARIATEHSNWNSVIASGIQPDLRRLDNDRTPDRPLNIGYVSPDFREHPVGRFLLPLFSHHDHENYRAFCYSDVRHPDALTRDLQSHADVWRITDRLSDDQLARQIREDRIDILIDLTMHMDGNRLPVFARAPAPVQATYLAYCSTTGLTSMNYRISDPHLDRPIVNESVYVEKTVRLARSYWCYQAPSDAPEVAPLPAALTGRITFGCLNNYSKVTSVTWEMWHQILESVPQSQLILQCPRGVHRDLVRRQMAAVGLDPNRLIFVNRVSFSDYLALYNRIDIALDPFPYGGGTTTFDALYMGVPVVTMTGKTAVSHAGSSILHNLGFPQWIAPDRDRYVQIAVKLASDINVLSEMRSQLRPKMMSSPLTDAPSFARDFESVLRRMWKVWCAS